MADEETQGGGQATAAPPAPDQGAQPPATGDQNPQPGAAADWLKTAQAKPDVQQQTAPQTGQMAEQAAPPPAPVVVTSMKRQGLLGVVDSIADVLAGKQRPELGKDADGDLYVKQHTLTRGEQWMKIAATAFHGAAAGYAAGQGAGNQGKAAEAGIQAGQQDQDRQKANAKDMSAEVQQQQLQKANNQMLQMKIAEQTWNQARQKVTASQEDIKFNDEQTKQLTDPVEKGGGGGKVIGTAAHAGDIGEILKVQPDVMAHLVQKGTIQIRKNLDADGNVIGIKAILMPDEWAKTTLPPGATGHVYNPLSKQIEPFTYSDPVTKGEQAVHDAAAVTAKDEADEKARKITKDQADLEHTKQETATSAATASEVPSKIAENKASATEKYATASKAPSEIAKNTAEAQAATEKAGDDPALVTAIAHGQIPAGRMSYLLARNPALLTAVMKEDPGFDGSKVEAYTRAYADFTSGHTSQELLSGGTALEHLAELRDLNNTKSHIWGTPEYNAYQNKADTVATELAKFYGDSTIPAIASIKKTLTSTLPGTREAAITTQAGSMADRMDNYAQKWQNASPSSAYEAQMPGISPKAKAAWATLDPKFKTRAAADIFSKQAPAPPPTAATHSFSVKAWRAANPTGDVNAAKTAAQAQHLDVIP